MEKQLLTEPNSSLNGPLPCCRLPRFLTVMNLQVYLPRSYCQQHIQSKPNEACKGHDHKHKPITVGSNARIATPGRLRCLGVVEEPGEEAGEEEGTKGKVQYENVIDEAIVLEAKELRGRGD